MNEAKATRMIDGMAAWIESKHAREVGTMDAAHTATCATCNMIQGAKGFLAECRAEAQAATRANAARRPGTMAPDVQARLKAQQDADFAFLKGGK